MFKRGLEDFLQGDYRSLQSALKHNGRLPSSEVNRFLLYQFGQPGLADETDQRGTFFAVRESRLEANTIETALFWSAPSLDDAVADLSSLPDGTAGEEMVKGVFNYKNGAITLGFFMSAGVLLGIEIGIVSALTYSVFKVAFNLGFDQMRRGNVLKTFGSYTAGKEAIREMIELTEISMDY
jgi:hypothetical protein